MIDKLIKKCKSKKPTFTKAELKIIARSLLLINEMNTLALAGLCHSDHVDKVCSGWNSDVTFCIEIAKCIHTDSAEGSKG